MKEMNSQMLLQTLSKRILEFVGDKPFRSKNYYFDEERIQGYTEVGLFEEFSAADPRSNNKKFI